MASATINDFTTDLLQKDLVVPRRKSTLGTEAETSNLLSQIALSLYMNPRAALYFIILARNALVSAISAEMTKIGEVRKAVSDLKNISFAIRDSGKLSNAVSSLTSAAQSGVISDSQIATVSGAIDSFLSGDVRKNAVSTDLSGLIRPASEASVDLPALLADLKSQHSTVLSKLYNLVVASGNFESVDFQSINGPTVLNRIRDGISLVVEEAVNDPSGSGSREMVNRLIAYKAALSTVTRTVDPRSPLLDSANGIPKGYSVKAVSTPTSAVVTGPVGPYTFPATYGISLQDSSGTLTESRFPIRSYDLNSQAHVIGTLPTSYPVSPDFLVTVQAGTTVGTDWVQVGSLYQKTFLVQPGSVANASAFMTSIQAAVGPSLVDVVEYPFPGSGRFTIIGKSSPHSVTYVGIPSAGQIFNPGPLLVTAAPQDLARFSVREGFYGPVQVTEVADCLNAMFGGKIIAARTNSDEIAITGKSSTPGAFLTVAESPSTVLGLSGTARAASAVFSLIGSISGSAETVISPLGLMGLFDYVTVPTGFSSVAGLSQQEITLADPLPTFSGSVIVNSRLLSVHDALQEKLSGHLTNWASSGFSVDLSKIDRSIASAAGSRSLSAIGDAVNDLTDLSIALADVITLLTDPDTSLPSGAAAFEVKLATSILDSLSERRMDLAEQLLLEGRIQEALLSDTQSLSYGGSLSKALTDLAQNDVSFPNLATTDGIQPTAVRRS